MRRVDYVHTAVRIALGAVFLYAGVIKIPDPVAFAGSIAAYQILPFFWNYVAAATIPWVEALSGLMLIAGFRTRSAAAVITGLNIVFTVAVGTAMARGLDIKCGCFRESGGGSPLWLAFIRDLVFLSAALYLLRPRSDSRP